MASYMVEVRFSKRVNDLIKQYYINQCDKFDCICSFREKTKWFGLRHHLIIEVSGEKKYIDEMYKNLRKAFAFTL